MGVHVKDLLNHLRERQVHLGVEAFHFLHVLRNNNLEPSAYPAEALDSLTRKKNVAVDPSTSEEVLGASPRKGGRTSPRKQRKAKVQGNVISADTLPTPTDVEAASLRMPLPSDATGSVIPTIANGHVPSLVPLIPKFVFPTQTSTSVPAAAHLTSFPQPVPIQPTPPPLMPMPTDLPPNNPYCPQAPYSAFPFHPQYMAYLLQQQGLSPATWQVAPPPPPPDVSMADIDPQLPPGPPIFFNPVHTAMEPSVQLPVTTPVKKTPKRKRSASVAEADNMPSRSNRKRKPTKRYLDSLETDTLVL
jgi:hypothetical protein